jgi:YD repeat-containing protein
MFKKSNKGFSLLISFFLIAQLFAPFGAAMTISPQVAYAANDSAPCQLYPDSSPSFNSEYGGIELNKAAEFLADMDDITGAYYDEESNRIVFIGTATSTLPEFDKDDLAVAIKAVIFNDSIPAISIDFKDINDPEGYPNMDVTFTAGIEDTNFGQDLYFADVALKQFMLGYDGNQATITSSVSGYKSVLHGWVDNGPDPSKNSASRYWISPANITLKEASSSDAFVFDNVQMQVETEALVGNMDPAWVTASEDFATHQTNNYDAFANEVPAYGEVKQLAKIVGVVKWIKDNGIGVDFEWAKDYETVSTTTPDEFPMITTPSIDGGMYEHYAFGGVDYGTSNTYESDTQGTSTQLQSASEAAASSSTDGIHWTFNSSGKTYDAVSVSAGLFRAAGAYSYNTNDTVAPTASPEPLELNRSYSSFAVNDDVGFGPGWNFFPASMDNPLPGAQNTQYCNFSGVFTGIVPDKISVTTPDNGRETFTFSCVGVSYYEAYDADNPKFTSRIEFRNAGSNGLIFDVFTKNYNSYSFFAKSATSTDYKLLKYDSRLGNPVSMSQDYVRKYTWDTSTSTLLTIQDIREDLTPSSTFNGTNLAFNYNVNDQIKSVVGPRGTTTYSYNVDGLLVGVTDMRGSTTTYAYSSDNLLTSISDRSGTTFIQNEYDELGRVATQTSALGLVKTLDYDDENLQIIWSDENGRTGSSQYDENGRVVGTTNASNATTSFVYGSSYTDAPTALVDVTGATTTYTFNNEGFITSKTDPDGGQTQYTWVKEYGSNLSKITNNRHVSEHGTSQVTNFSYIGNQVSQMNISGHGTTSYKYTPQGLLATTTFGVPNFSYQGDGIERTYNSQGLLTKLRDRLDGDTIYAYNNAGYMTQVTNPDGVSTTHTYDPNGNMLTSTNAVSTVSYIYDVNDRPTSVINGNGATTTFAYTSTGNLATTTDAMGAATKYYYDEYNNLTTVSDALDNDIEYTHDSLNQETDYELVSGKTYVTKYDTLGNPTVVIDPNGRIATSTYDSMSRLTTQKINGELFTYTYDDVGRVKTLASDVGTTTYTYDKLDRVIEVGDPYGSNIQYAYNSLGNISEITYPDNKTLENEYDEEERLIKQTDWNNEETTYTYTNAGLLDVTTLPNGVTINRNYDSANRLSSITHRDYGLSIIFRQEYTYDDDGNIIEIDEDGSAIAADEVSYDYDLAGRTINRNSATTTSEGFAYDMLGNLIAQRFGLATTTYSHTLDNELATSTFVSSGTGGPGLEFAFLDQESELAPSDTLMGDDVEVSKSQEVESNNEGTSSIETPAEYAGIQSVISTEIDTIETNEAVVSTSTPTSSTVENELEASQNAQVTTSTSPEDIDLGNDKNAGSESEITADGLITNAKEASIWRQYHRDRVAYLKQNTKVTAEIVRQAEKAQEKYESFLMKEHYITDPTDEINVLSYNIKKFFIDSVKVIAQAILPEKAYAYLFNVEDFESCGSLPCSLNNDASWGDVTTSLDSGSQVNGNDSLKAVVTGEGGGAIESVDYSTGEIWAQFKVYIPSSFQWGTSGYFNIFRTEDSSNGSVVWMNVEDYGTPRLTVMGDVLGYTNTGIDLTEGVVNTIEVRLKTGTSTGDVDIWLDNTVEGSPDYDGSGTMNLGTDNVDDILFGMNYVPETGLSTTYYDDLVVNNSFIGSLAVANATPTAPTSLQTESLTNPTNVSDTTPEFSAVYNDPDSGDNATYYQIQVDDNSNFSSVYWNSGKTGLATTTEGSLSPDISYGGSTLASSTTYYWRVKFWDDSNAEGAWSTATSTFSLAAGGGGSTTTEYHIYDDSIDSSWNDWSWSTTLNESDTSPVYAGSYSLETAYGGSWTGLYLRNSSFDLSPYNELKMQVYVGNNTNDEIYIYLTNASGTAMAVKSLSDYISGGYLSNTWQTAIVPLSELDATNYSGAMGFVLESPVAMTVNYDEIMFVGTTTSSSSGSLDTTFVYDNSGNLLSVTNDSANKTFSWNTLGLLDTAVVNGTVAEFIYDTAGNRIAKSANNGSGTTTTRFVNDVLAPNALVLAETDTLNDIQRYNIWGPNGLVSTGDASTTSRYYPLTDHHGSVRLLTDASGNVINSYEYTTYGEVTTASSTPVLPYRYTSEQHDDETGLIYLRARYLRSITWSLYLT